MMVINNLLKRICTTWFLLFMVAIWSAFSSFPSLVVIRSFPLHSRNASTTSANPSEHASWKATSMQLQHRMINLYEHGGNLEFTLLKMLWNWSHYVIEQHVKALHACMAHCVLSQCKKFASMRPAPGRLPPRLMSTIAGSWAIFSIFHLVNRSIAHVVYLTSQSAQAQAWKYRLVTPSWWRWIDQSGLSFENRVGNSKM